MKKKYPNEKGKCIDEIDEIGGLSLKEIVKSMRNQEFMVNFSNYLNIIDGNLDYRFNKSLSILGKYLDVCRIYIFEDFENGQMARNTYEWCKQGITSEKLQNQKVVYNKHLQNLKSKLYKDGVVYSSDIENFPRDIAQILQDRNAQSILVLPLYVFNEYYGFIGIDTCETTREWDDMEIGFLKNISLIISTSFERRLINREIKNNEIKFRDLFNYSSDSIFIYGSHGEIFEANQRACESLGYSREDLLIRKINNFFPNESSYSNLIYLSDEKSDIHAFESEFLKASGEKFPVEINNRGISFNGQQSFLCVVRDISERKQMEREILSAIIQAEEKERGRIARDLHDGLGPLLSSLKLFVKVSGVTTEHKKREEMIKNINEVIDEAILLIKEISNNLSPHVLNDFGLASAIQSFCKKITITKAIDIKFDSNVFDQRFQMNVEIVLFRILKELVNNTIKHALASRIEIFLLRTGKQLTLIYSDNGVGFDIKRVLDNNATGMGISNIVNRIGSINGKLIFDSQSGKGIQFKVEVELKN